MGVLNSILLATDFRESSQEAARAAVKLAAAFSSAVTVFHVLEEHPTWPVTPQENQDRLLKHLASQNIDVTDLLVSMGPPAELILKKTQELQPDLLLIGTGEKRQDDRLILGPVTHTILSQTSSATLVVNPFGPKLTFQTIVCPVDHSPSSRHGLEDAIQLARAFKSKLVVISVIPEVSWLGAVVETGHLTDAQQEHELRWIQEFDAFLEPVDFDNVAWERMVLTGAAHEQIRQAAQNCNADLIVMGATGRTGLVRMLLGSVTRRVLDNLPCSLLVVKSEQLFEENLHQDIDAVDRLLAEGLQYQAEGKLEDAVGKFRQVLAIDPFHLPTLDPLIQVSEQLGQQNAARHYRKRAERLRQRTGN